MPLLMSYDTSPACVRARRQRLSMCPRTLAVALTLALSACSDGTSTVEVSEDGTVVEVRTERMQQGEPLFMDVADIHENRDLRRDAPMVASDIEAVGAAYFDQTRNLMSSFVNCVENFYGPSVGEYEAERRAVEVELGSRANNFTTFAYDDGVELCGFYMDKISDCLASRGVNISPEGLKNSHGFSNALVKSRSDVSLWANNIDGTLIMASQNKDRGCVY